MKAICLFLLLLSAGCQYDPYVDDKSVTKPNQNDIMGTYKFEKQTVTGNLKHHLTSKSALTINSDGTFEAVELPNFLGTLDFVYQENISVKGKWKIETVGSVEKWDGTKSVWGLRLSNLPENLRTMSFFGDPPDKLMITYGDPDAGEVMILAK